MKSRTVYLKIKGRKMLAKGVVTKVVPVLIKGVPALISGGAGGTMHVRAGNPDLDIKLDNGKSVRVSSVSNDVYIVPKKIPEVWQEILDANKDVPDIKHIGVCNSLYHRPEHRTQ
jgi:hypothetical protein